MSNKPPKSDKSIILNKNISLVAVNVGGITSKFRYKILGEYIKKYDIALFGETKLQRIPQTEFPDYDIFSMKQKTRLHGLSLLVKTGLFNYTKKINGTSPCVLWVLFGSSERNLNFIVGSVYIPGYDSKFGDSNDFVLICEDILTLHEKYNCPFILMGDFNARSGNLDSFNHSAIHNSSLPPLAPRFSQDKKVDTYGRNLIKLCKDLNMRIANGTVGSDRGIGNFTCHKKNRSTVNESVVDYCLVSESLLPCISEFYVDTFDRCMSDVHSPICLGVKNVPVVKNDINFSNENGEKILFKSKWNPESKTDYQNSFIENDIGELSDKILAQQLSGNPTKADIENLVTDLTSVIVKPAKKVGLCKKISSKNSRPRKSPNQSWFNSECEKRRKKFFEAKNDLRKAKMQEKKDNCGENVRKSVECEEKMDQEGKEYKKYISMHQKEFTKELHKNLRELHRHHPKEYWNILKKCDGTKKSEPKVSMSEFENHFKNLNQTDNTNNTQTHDFDPGSIDPSTIQEFNLDFTIEEITKNISDLNNNKSEGLDFVKNEYIKNCPPTVVELIVKIFNLILRTGHVPYDWSVGLIVPIFKKKGSPFDPGNYRGITLLSCLGKLFTLSVNIRLTQFATNQGIIGEEQAAFREGYSTMDHAFVLNELINIYLHNNKRLYGCFIDYKKAFDTINRNALWSKVIENGINGKILKVIYNMYETAKSCVKQQSMISGLFACNMGVRQGENLSPLLFAIFLNDFEISLSSKYNGLTSITDLSRILGTDNIEFFINMYLLLYADDTLVMAESPAELQLALDEVDVYCKKWGLSINQTKTEVVIFSRGKVKTQFNFKIGDINLKTQGEYCYLGTIFNFNGKFTKAIEERITPARKAMFGLNAKAVNLLLPPDIHIDLFEKMISPILLYGCEVWGYSNLEPLEVFYRSFIKRVLGIGKSTANCIIYGEVGKYPLAYRVFKRMISFWIKISEGKSSKLSSIMYKLIFKLHINNSYHSPWLMCIKKILCNSGNPYFWYEQELLSPKVFMKNVVALQLEKQYLQEWEFEVNRNRKCITYIIFEDEFAFEPYLSKLNFIDRRALCKFRTGNHTLPVTKSRYVAGGGGVDVICKLCNTNDVCDEFHVLFICKFFEESRKKYLKRNCYTKPSTLKMYTLFNYHNSSHKQTVNLAKFVRNIMSNF